MGKKGSDDRVTRGYADPSVRLSGDGRERGMEEIVFTGRRMSSLSSFCRC